MGDYYRNRAAQYHASRGKPWPASSDRMALAAAEAGSPFWNIPPHVVGKLLAGNHGMPFSEVAAHMYGQNQPAALPPVQGAVPGYYGKRAEAYMKERGRPYPASSDRAADMAHDNGGGSINDLERIYGYNRKPNLAAVLGGGEGGEVQFEGSIDPPVLGRDTGQIQVGDNPEGLWSGGRGGPVDNRGQFPPVNIPPRESMNAVGQGFFNVPDGPSAPAPAPQGDRLGLQQLRRMNAAQLSQAAGNVSPETQARFAQVQEQGAAPFRSQTSYDSVFSRTPPPLAELLAGRPKQYEPGSLGDRMSRLPADPAEAPQAAPLSNADTLAAMSKNRATFISNAERNRNALNAMPRPPLQGAYLSPEERTRHAEAVREIADNRQIELAVSTNHQAVVKKAQNAAWARELALHGEGPTLLKMLNGEGGAGGSNGMAILHRYGPAAFEATMQHQRGQEQTALGREKLAAETKATADALAQTGRQHSETMAQGTARLAQEMAIARQTADIERAKNEAFATQKAAEHKLEEQKSLWAMSEPHQIMAALSSGNITDPALHSHLTERLRQLTAASAGGASSGSGSPPPFDPAMNTVHQQHELAKRGGFITPGSELDKVMHNLRSNTNVDSWLPDVFFNGKSRKDHFIEHAVAGGIDRNVAHRWYDNNKLFSFWE